MNQLIISILAFVAGILLTIQGGLNTQLGILLKHPLLATLVAFFFSMCFSIIFVLSSVKSYPTTQQIKAIPTYLWFTGGLFSMLGVSLYYYTIPKLGVSTMISLGLCGQLFFSVIAGHFGWFGLPVEPITLKRSLGILAMGSGILLINLK
ncbi:MAG: DMT family transporter [Reichenbachiella sp.]|uniref:DMT family transporter n=1 Tax=Reichenbachiella sp. TaxID=2184521 RepID=UPI00326528EC